MRIKKTLAEILADQTLEPKQKYKWYINSSNEWKQIRDIVLERDNYRCRCCGRTDDEAVLSVHHRSYEYLFQEQNNNYEDLITVCNVCHKAIHSAKSNIKRFKMEKNE